MASGRIIILVLQNIPEGTEIDGHVVDTRQLKDLNRGRAYLAEMADRYGVKHFATVEEAMPAVVEAAKQA